MEALELTDHPFFTAVQFHPEYLSRPLRPSPPYLGLLMAASGQLDTYLTTTGMSKVSLRKKSIRPNKVKENVIDDVAPIIPELGKSSVPG